MNECTVTSDADKKKLSTAYHSSKKAKGQDGKVGQLAEETLEDNSSLFAASFCQGAVEATVMADQGSDVNILTPDVFKKVCEAGTKLRVTNLDRTRNYGTVDKTAAPLPCSRRIKTDVLLRSRHGENLVLRNIEWLVSDKPVDCTLIGRHVLRALGLDNRVLLAVACDRFKGDVDIDAILPPNKMPDPTAGTIHSLLQHRDFEFGSTFHSQGATEEDKLEDSDIYIDLGDDPEEALDKALADRIQQARANGMSEDGCRKLSLLLEENRSVFRIRLGKSPPADVQPMRVRLLPNSKPVRVKARRYSPEQRAFMEKYADKLLEMQFAQVLPTASWQAAPLIVPKPGSKSNTEWQSIFVLSMPVQLRSLGRCHTSILRLWILQEALASPAWISSPRTGSFPCTQNPTVSAVYSHRRPY